MRLEEECAIQAARDTAQVSMPGPEVVVDLGRLKIQFRDKRWPSSPPVFTLLIPMFISLPLKAIPQDLQTLLLLFLLPFL